ncbi:MAG: hypothetical protein H0T41_11505 [Rhodobacteraceae bacterium]|nr:hypothetical protein [Paracoccaceae bacterium]
MSDLDATTLWWIAIALALVVTGVVAVLLRLIVATAADIEGGVSEIWTRGQRVASNTIHIASLYRTRDLVDGILGRAGGILGDVRAITRHAETCPGCPECFLRRKT